ncbi:DsbA family protein [Ruania halotolerans]|uniref:DsbA family protein n=1 Tax=Ruania halotolerans TaxID=2897773 RepID=UPI001E3F4770|nr:thioredoxin domain-containing protein [Ruania halotolerans]UFU07209.1 DsbA family protein [Ruania halotolerans]
MAQNSKTTKTERREAARLEAERLRKIHAKRDKRNRGILIGVIVLVVALIATAAILIAQQAGRTLLSDFEGETPAGADLHGGISIGAEGAGSVNEGAPEVDIYVDFICPFCGDFEEVNGSDVADAAASGDATVIYHPLNYLDGASSGTEYSTRAANAFATVATEAPEQALDFMAAMFANQPAEGSAGLTDEEIAQIAVDAGVPQEAADSISEGTYREWIAVASDQARRDGIGSTPTIQINGDDWDENWQVPGTLLTAIQDAA